jgi:hypothetical protein
MRALLIALLALGGSDIARAATAPAWAAECAKLDDDAARLACYDVRNPPHKSAARNQNATAPAVAATARTPAPGLTTASGPASARTAAAAPAPASPAAAALTSAPPAVPAPSATPDANFGLAERPAPAAAKPANLVAMVDSVSERAGGELLLKLDNGQSWVQAQRKAGARIKAGEHVTIARGAFGGYLLSSDSGATMRVRRLQ